MTPTIFARYVCFSIMLLGFTSLVRADSLPGWLQQAAAQQPGTYDKDVSAVVLYKEQSVTLDGGGRLTTVERYAVRVLTREGRKEAAAVGFYLTKFSEVKDIEAWMIAPGGTVKSYGKKETIDQIAD